MQLELTPDPERPGDDSSWTLFGALSLAPIGVAVLDLRLRYVQVNAWLAEQNGLPAEAHVGRTFAELFPEHAADAARAEERMRAALESGAASTASARIRTEDGGWRDWLATYVPVLGADGRARALCAVVVDVTADRERESAQERAREGAERAARRLAYALEVTAALAAASDAAAVAEVILGRARDVVGADAATIRVLRGGALELVGARQDPGAPEDLDLLGDPAAIAEAVRGGEPLWLEDRDALARCFPAVARHPPGAGMGAAVVLPLAARGRPFGALTFTFGATRGFDLEERAVVLALAEHCAQALDRALLHERERERGESAVSARDRAVQLQAVTAALSAARTVPEVAAALVAHAGTTLAANAAALYVIAPDRTSAVLAHDTRLAKIPDAFVRLPLDAPVPVSHVIRSGATVTWATQAEGIERWPALAGVLRVSERCAILPLAAGGETLGAVMLAWPEQRAFDANELALVGAVANACAQAIARAAAYEAERAARAAAERATSRAERLLAVTAALSSAATGEEVALVLARRAHAELGVTSSVTYELEAGGRSLRLLGVAGDAEAHREAVDHLAVDFPAPAPTAARTGEPVWLERAADLAAEYPRFAERWPYTRRFGALAALPLRVRGEVLGAVAFGYAAERPIPPEERALLSAVADLAAQALDRARLVDRERAARAAEARAHALLEQMVERAPAGIGFLDRDLRYQVVNPALAEMNGLTIAAHLGKTPRELFPSLPLDDIERALRRVRDTGEPIRDLEITGETPAGGRRTWLESWYPLWSGGDVIGVALLVREVTREREAEQFQRHVVGIVGHDLRNPLSAIVSATALLRRGPLAGTPQASLVERVASSAGRIREIVEVLLDFARVREGGVPLRRTQCDLAAVARAAAEECEAAHPGRTVACEAHGDCAGEWDPHRIAQLVTNLLVNALSYSPAHTPVLVQCEGEADEVRIEVANAGPPIPPEVLPRLFEPFQRGDRRPSGLGLGLFIARAIAGAHGGRISCRSSAGAGTVFSVHLPRTPRA